LVNIMKGRTMRSSLSNDTSLQRWLLRGSILVGMSWFAACSSETPGDGGDGGDNGTCTADTSSDPQNCGSCGNACVVGQACVGGSCRVSCVTPEVECSGACVNTASNANHCGACGMACATGELCQASQCETGSCAAGTTLCAGSCVDTQTNLSHCGACGRACLIGQSCTAGVCTGGGTGGSGGTGAGGSTSGGSTNGGSTSGGSTSGGSDAGGMSGSGTTGGAGGMTGGSGGMTGGSAGSSTGGSGGGSTGECRVWLATNGADTNPGTESQPVLTLLKAYDLMCPKPPDGTENGAECTGAAPRTICVKSGTYNMTERLEFRKTRMGTASSRLVLQGAPGVTLAQRPVFNFSSQTRLGCGENPDNIGGLTVNANYVTVKNLVVRNANDTCILVQGTQGLIENVLTHNCADTGIQISSGGEFTGSGTNNTIKNCDSHSNNDSQCNGENADGFAIKEGTGTGNVFSGCRAWNNADDGYDFFAWTSPVRLENSWAIDQSRTTEGSGSDGNGFKLGGDEVSATHQLSALFAHGNVNGSNGDGFTRNSNPASMSCSGCAAWGNTDNAGDGISGLPGSAPSGANVTNMTGDGARNADGSLKPPNML
jgi:hypothetical protein